MEDLFDILIVIGIAVFGIMSKNSKKKKSQSKKAAASPVKAPEPVTEPLSSGSDRKMINRTNIENAVKAFSELAESLDKAKTPVQPAPKPAPARKQLTAIEAEAAVKQHAEVIKARVMESLTGLSPVDEHGCIGGSMPDHEAEGESIAEHAAHEQNRRQKLAEEAALSVEAFRKPSAADLRRAVVMSEVLDKPVSLRGRSI